MEVKYVHPILKTKAKIEDGFLCFDKSRDRLQVINNNDCYNFTALSDKTKEGSHYDSDYSDWIIDPKLLTKDQFLKQWDIKTAFQLLQESIGDVNGKTILLIGNGASTKELLFLLQGANIIYTDLSLNVILKVKGAFEKSDLWDNYNNKIIFQSINALNLPYEDASFDIIYGCAFVHHLSELDLFLAETYRCLKKDGQCFFLDNAYSRWWQFLKSTFFKPLQLFSHWRTGISPEDIKATKKGGFQRNELDELFTKQGFHSIIYKRVMFFEFFLYRGAMKLIHPKVSRSLSLVGRKLDRIILGKKFIRGNGMFLVWGAEK